MEVEYVQSEKVAFTPAHVQLACDGVYMALPLTRSSVGVWSIQDITYQPIELIGHRKVLTAMALGNVVMPKQLVSAAEDYVIVWNLQHARQQFEKGEKIVGRVIGTTLGYVQYCAFSHSDTLVAVCTGYDIVILHSTHENKVAVLEGHNGTVTAAEFCPHYTSTLVSISDDRSFKVWNLENLSLVYQSPILTASPFISMSMSVHEAQVAVGAADGVLRVFDLTDGNGFRCLHQIDVSKIIAREKDAKIMAQNCIKKGPVTISSRPTWKQADRNSFSAESQDAVEDSVETGYSVLCLYYTYVCQDVLSRQASAVSLDLPFLPKNTSVVNDLLTTSPMLMVGTTSGLLQINAHTLDVCSYVDFQEPIACQKNRNTDTKVLNAAGSVIFGQGAETMMWCIVGSPFQNVVHILKWNQSSQTCKNQSSGSHGAGESCKDLEERMSAMETPSGADSTQKHIELTVLSKTSMLDDSPLRADLMPKHKDTKDRKLREFVTPPRKGSIVDNQPITFKTKIKSSGYSAPPRMTMFKPQTSFSSNSKTPPSKSSTGPVRTVQEYPIHGVPPVNLDIKLEVAERPTAVNSITISDGGRSLACALANKSALTFSVPLSQNSATAAYTGHNHIVTCVDWSHSGSRLITSSDDKTASVWIKGQSDPVMTFDRLVKNTACMESQINDKDNKAFGKEVHFGQFYFMDKFILLSVGNQFYMYKYYIDSNKNDIQRYLPQCKYKLVQEWSVESQQISAMSAINSFLSYIVICACSNKSIEVYDMNVGERVRTMSEVHTRPVHAICQNEGSQFVSHPSSAYDLFASAAAGDCMKLWDLRTNRCVRRYEGHLNRVHPCGLSFSPCGRFIATGSEDRCSYIFDMRSGTYLHKLQGHTDVVSDVAFHPLKPQLITASLDGKLLIYTNR